MIQYDCASKEYDILVALDTCVDLLVDCGETEPEFGQKEKLINGYKLEMGGSGCIFACQCAKLGLKTAGVGTLGNDIMSNIVMDGLESSGVITSFVRRSDAVATGFGIALVKSSGDRSILTYMGTIDKVDSKQLNDLLEKTGHLHICSYYLQKNLQKDYKDILINAKRLGMSTSIDTNWDPDENWDSGVKDLLPYIDVFLPNENELMFITGHDNIKDALSSFGKKAPVIAVKCGGNGAYVYHNGMIHSSKALMADVVDTVGAGDSFNGGFIYGLLSGMPVEDCLKAGIICGSKSTSAPGGIRGQPDLNTLKQILTEWENEKEAYNF